MESHLFEQEINLQMVVLPESLYNNLPFCQWIILFLVIGGRHFPNPLEGDKKNLVYKRYILPMG